MSDFFATEDDYARMVQAVGPKLAKKYMDADRKRGGMNIVPTEVEFKPVNGGLGVGGSDVNENDTIGSGALSIGSSEGDGSTDVAGLDLGGIPVAALGSIRKKMSAYSKLADEQKAFYDQLEQELLTRRIGPSKGEQLLQMSAALLQPTETRGFGASLANLVPVLQQQAQERREGLTSRADALQRLRTAQLAGKKDLLGQELQTEVKLAQLEANRNKPRYIQTTDATGKVTLTPVFPGQAGQLQVNPEDVRTLFRNPENLPLDELKRLFDETYGVPGLANQYLGGQK